MVSKNVNTHFIDEMIVIQRIEITCSILGVGVTAGLKSSFYDYESKVENRAGQPVGKGNLR